MGYRIQYGQTMVKTHLAERKKLSFSRKKLMLLIAGLAILFAVVLCSRGSVQNFLLPGNSQVTRSAVSNMVNDLKVGDPLSDVFEAFCREIIDGANLPE